MDCGNINLDYLKDTDGNYILRNKTFDNSNFSKFIKHIGTYSENLLISRKYFDKKLKHKLEDIVNRIENSVMIEQKITMDDIISERIILKIKPEEEFNPIFKIMDEKEIAEYTIDSKKVRVEINFEMYIKPRQHLLLNGFLNSLMDFKK